MANDYFQFKKFRIDQKGSAMKVCTDSCIFGGWIKAPNAQRILDIGTGTGLLALMVRQRHSAQIDAVEIDEEAFLQARTNVINSPWKDTISVFHSDINDFLPLEEKLYDAIICNPPFFKNHLLSAQPKKNQVLHGVFLTQEVLLDQVKRLLKPGGNFFVMLPYWESVQMEKLAQTKNLWPEKKLIIKEKSDKEILRVLTSYTDHYLTAEMDQLIIRGGDSLYTNGFRELLQDYYLQF